MPRFSVCVEMVFRPLPFVERLEAVARAGYDAFEFWNWQDKDLKAIDVQGRKCLLVGINNNALYFFRNIYQ